MRGREIKREAKPLLDSPCCRDKVRVINYLQIILAGTPYYEVVIYSSVK